MKIRVLTGLCFIFIASVARAECPVTLDADQLTECLMIEGSGSDYQDWKEKYNRAESSDKKEAIQTNNS